MRLNQDYHANFTVAAEFREKIKRTKEDFGASGLFFSCETLRGVFDFPVKDANYFEKENFNPFDVILIDGRLSMRTGRVMLEPVSFRLCEGSELMQEAVKLVEYGVVTGQMFVQRKGYNRSEDDAFIPRVEVKGIGFVDSFIDADLYDKLPRDDSSLLMAYQARISLDMSYERRNNSVNRRSAWVLSGQSVEPIRTMRRPAEKEVTK